MSNANRDHKPGDGSTGALTIAGKYRSSCNATTHGARSERHIILPDESAEDFENLRTHWFNEFPPVGEQEADMIERIAQTQWRLIRCERLLNEAEAEAFAIDLKPRNWPEEQRKYVELMMRYRTTADRAFRSARRDVETLRRNRVEMMLLEEKTRQAMLASRRAGIEEPLPPSGSSTESAMEGAVEGATESKERSNVEINPAQPARSSGNPNPVEQTGHPDEKDGRRFPTLAPPSRDGRKG